MEDRTHVFSRAALWNLIRNESNEQHAAILQQYVTSTLKCELTVELKQNIFTFISEVRKRAEKKYKNKNKLSLAPWLTGNEEFGLPRSQSPENNSIGAGHSVSTPSASCSSQPPSSAGSSATAQSTSGRKATDYADSSERTKRRKVQTLLSEYPIELFADATRAGHKQGGNKDTAALLSECLETTPTRGT